MKLSELHPDDVMLVSAAPADESGANSPLKLSALHPDDVQVVQAAPNQGGGFLSDARQAVLGGVAKVGQTVDRYGGAPVRSAIMAAESGDNPIPAYTGQFGQDPSLAPTGKDIAAKMGLSTDSVLSPFAQRLAAAGMKASPLGFITSKALPGLQENMAGASPAGIAGVGIDAAADPLNFLPAADIAKGISKVGVGAAEAAGKVAEAGGWAGKKAFSSVFGVSPETASQYLARRQAVNAAPELATIKDGVDSAVRQLADAVDSGKVKVGQAQDALSDLKTQVRNQLVDAKVDAREAVRRTEAMFKESAANLLQPIKDTRAPTDRAADVSDMVGKLKQQVQGASGQALETLNNSNAKVDLSKVYNQVDNTVDRLKAAGTDDALSIANKLQDYKARLMTQNWAQVDAPQAKNLIKGLDQITTYSPMAGAFDQAKNSAFKGIRSALDQSLKDTVPAYRAQMESLAPQTQLLENANAAFGTPELAVGKLGRMNTPRGEFDRATLAQLEGAVGSPGAVTGDVDRFAKAQALLKDPQAIQQMQRQLPEYDAYRQAMAKLAKMRPDWSRNQLEQAMSRSKEARDLSMAQGRLNQAQQAYEPFSGLTPNSTQSKLESFAKPRGASIETSRALQGLDQATGNNFTQQIKDRAVLDSFEKGNVHGSRNTLFYGALGLAFHGVEGGVAGATFGHQIMDRYGPKVGKAILDGIGRVAESPGVQTIRSLNLPSNIKAELEGAYQSLRTPEGQNAFRAAIQSAKADAMAGRGASTLPSVASRETDRSPARGPDAWAQSGLSKLGIQDQGMSARLLADPKAKQLLIQASDLAPNSKAMKRIMDQIQKGWGQK